MAKNNKEIKEEVKKPMQKRSIVKSCKLKNFVNIPLVCLKQWFKAFNARLETKTNRYSKERDDDSEAKTESIIKKRTYR